MPFTIKSGSDPKRSGLTDVSAPIFSSFLPTTSTGMRFPINLARSALDPPPDTVATHRVIAERAHERAEMIRALNPNPDHLVEPVQAIPVQVPYADATGVRSTPRTTIGQDALRGVDGNEGEGEEPEKASIDVNATKQASVQILAETPRRPSGTHHEAPSSLKKETSTTPRTKGANGSGMKNASGASAKGGSHKAKPPTQAAAGIEGAPSPRKKEFKPVPPLLRAAEEARAAKEAAGALAATGNATVADLANATNGTSSTAGVAGLIAGASSTVPLSKSAAVVPPAHVVASLQDLKSHGYGETVESDAAFAVYSPSKVTHAIDGIIIGEARRTKARQESMLAAANEQDETERQLLMSLEHTTGDNTGSMPSPHHGHDHHDHPHTMATFPPQDIHDHTDHALAGGGAGHHGGPLSSTQSMKKDNSARTASGINANSNHRASSGGGLVDGDGKPIDDEEQMMCDDDLATSTDLKLRFGYKSSTGGKAGPKNPYDDRPMTQFEPVIDSASGLPAPPLRHTAVIVNRDASPQRDFAARCQKIHDATPALATAAPTTQGYGHGGLGQSSRLGETALGGGGLFASVGPGLMSSASVAASGAYSMTTAGRYGSNQGRESIQGALPSPAVPPVLDDLPPFESGRQGPLWSSDPSLTPRDQQKREAFRRLQEQATDTQVMLQQRARGDVPTLQETHQQIRDRLLSPRGGQRPGGTSDASGGIGVMVSPPVSPQNVGVPDFDASALIGALPPGAAAALDATSASPRSMVSPVGEFSVRDAIAAAARAHETTLAPAEVPPVKSALSYRAPKGKTSAAKSNDVEIDNAAARAEDERRMTPTPTTQSGRANSGRTKPTATTAAAEKPEGKEKSAAVKHDVKRTPKSSPAEEATIDGGKDSSTVESRRRMRLLRAQNRGAASPPTSPSPRRDSKAATAEPSGSIGHRSSNVSGEAATAASAAVVGARSTGSSANGQRKSVDSRSGTSTPRNVPPLPQAPHTARTTSSGGIGGVSVMAPAPPLSSRDSTNASRRQSTMGSPRRSLVIPGGAVKSLGATAPGGMGGLAPLSGMTSTAMSPVPSGLAQTARLGRGGTNLTFAEGQSVAGSNGTPGNTGKQESMHAAVATLIRRQGGQQHFGAPQYPALFPPPGAKRRFKRSAPGANSLTVAIEDGSEFEVPAEKSLQQVVKASGAAAAVAGEKGDAEFHVTYSRHASVVALTPQGQRLSVATERSVDSVLPPLSDTSKVRVG